MRRGNSLRLSGRARGLVGLLAAVPALPVSLARADGLDPQPYRNTCAACHQEDGAGKAGMYPPLQNDAIVAGDPQKLLQVIIAGPAAALPVNRMHDPLYMPPFGGLSDAQIAALATYVRAECGHGASPVTPAQVTAARATLPP
jgi:mono/diheme cytochrome c family protein